MAVLKPAETATAYNAITPQVFATLAGAGALAAVAMILPGISGSFLLLVIGLYRSVVQAVSDLNIPLLIPIALGICAGLFIGAALVRFLIAKAPRETYGAVLGLVTGSILVLYPGGFGNGAWVIVSLVCMLAGAAISYFSGRHSE
jgi:putative membrane protein